MKNIIRNKLFAPIISLFLIFTPLKAEVNVVTSIKPLHSLTSYIMDGVGEPGLIIDGVASPHNFQIKPSHAKMLQKADLVIWVGEDLESFLPTALKSIPKNSVVLELLDQSGLKKLKFRENKSLRATMITDMMNMVKKKTIMMIMEMKNTQKKKKVMMTTDMMNMVMLMVNTTHIFG